MILGNDLADSKVWADGKINIFKKQPSVPPAKVFPDCSCVSPDVFQFVLLPALPLVRRLRVNPKVLSCQLNSRQSS